MKLINFFLILTFFVAMPAIFSNQAYAKKVTIAKKTFAFEAPEGFCELEKSQPFDRRILKAFEKENKASSRNVYAISGCGDLKAKRKGRGRGLQGIGFVAHVTDDFFKELNLPTTDSPTANIKDVKVKEKLMTLEEVEIKTRQIIDNNSSSDINHSEVSHEDKELGYIGRDNLAIYYTQYSNFRKGRQSVDMACVWAYTLIDGESFLFFYYKKFHSKQTFVTLKKYVSDWVSLTKSKNK